MRPRPTEKSLQSVSDSPTVSVIINCYNGSKYLDKCLRSVINQTYEKWEIIFWDNNSTDNSLEIAKRKNDLRIRRFSSDYTVPLYAARNLAIKKAKGEFVAFLDVDDWWECDKLAIQIPYFQKNNVGMVYTNYWFVDETNSSTCIGIGQSLKSGYILDWILKRDSIAVPTVVVRKKCLDLSAPCDPRFHVIGDFDLFVKIARSWEVVGVDKPLANYRWHGENETIRKKRTHLDELDMWLAENVGDAQISSGKGFNIRAESVVCRRVIDDITKARFKSAINEVLNKSYIKRSYCLYAKLSYRSVLYFSKWCFVKVSDCILKPKQAE